MSPREQLFPVGRKVILRDGRVAEVTKHCKCQAGGEAIEVTDKEGGLFIFCWCSRPAVKAEAYDIVGVVQPAPAGAGVVPQDPSKTQVGGVITYWTEDDVPVYPSEKKGRYIYGLYKGLKACWHSTGTACSKAIARIIGWVVWLVSDPPVVHCAG